METTQKHAVALTDEDYSRIDELVRKNGKRGVKLTDKKGVVNRFYRNDGLLYSDQLGKDGSVFTQECMKLSDIQNTQKAPFESAMKQKLKADYPTMTQEEVDAYADIIAEANESIKRLIASGVQPQMAHGVITDALRSRNVVGNVEKKVENEIIQP